MNKELILKYKKEFDYWLNGGKILMHYGKWTPVTLDAKWEFLLTDLEQIGSFGYVIDDEYVELRKALAEGKTIQYRSYTTEEWIDFNKGFEPTPSYTFLTVPEYYRVKPEGPKFKTGDWIIY